MIELSTAYTTITKVAIHLQTAIDGLKKTL